ncbi:MAG TPA: hypothetical protein VFO40_13995 [Chthoniobacterales bacterium]|nr:hypothetical protein [Chthoniobacterales bacterium]
MAPKESENLIAKLKSRADAEYRRRAELARMLGVARQRVTDWLAGRTTHTLDSELKTQAFLKKQRMCLPGISEELAIIPAQHQPRSTLDRVTRLAKPRNL